MVDLKRQYDLLRGEIDGAIRSVMERSQFILGPEVALLEQEIAQFHGVPYAIGVASGTDALLLALKACGVGRGDEVITSAFTFAATAEAITYLQAKPVFADISDTFTIDAADVESRLTPRTKAIVPVHLYGHPAEMDVLADLAEGNGLTIIEDCAQSFGATYNGRYVGSIGRCGCFSFYPSKNLGGCGDGGMIITSDRDVAEKILMLRNHGAQSRYEHAIIGYNSRLDEIQAAILRVKLRSIREATGARRAHAEKYQRSITAKDIVLPREASGCMHVYNQFTLRAPERKKLMAALQARDIASSIYYPIPLHRQAAFRRYHGVPGPSLPVSEACAREVLSLPMFPELHAEEIDQVCRVINDVH